ncbi:MAG: ABC transporter ATP-binding protein [Chloroflexia bacterium]
MSMPNGAFRGSPPGGRPEGRNRPSRPTTDNPQDEHSPDFRTILREAGRNARASLVGVPRVLRLVWGTNRGFTLSMGVLTIVQSAIPAAQVWLAGQLLQAVVDGVRNGGSEGAVRHIVILAVVQFLILAGSSLLDTLRNITQQLLQDRTANRIQIMIMEHANKLDLSFFEDAKFYDQLQQAQREATFRPVGMVSGVFSLVRTLLTFLSMIALLVQLGPLLAIVALLAPIPAFIASTRYGWHGYQQMRRQSPERRLMGYLTNLLTTDTYNKEIKLFTLGDFFAQRYRDISLKFIRENQGLVVRRYLAGFFWGALTIVASGGTYLYVALLAVRGTISIAGLTVYTQAAQQVQGNFQGLLAGLAGMYENTLYLNTLFDLLEFTPKIRAPEHPVPVSRSFTRGIEFRNVSYHYPGRDEPVLKNVSFTIAPGETIALVGRNGAGKTTIVKLLTRLYDPDEGQIMIDGVDIREYDPAELRHEIGVIFQDYVTYFLSAGENIGVGRLEALADRDRIADSAEQSGADG